MPAMYQIAMKSVRGFETRLIIFRHETDKVIEHVRASQALLRPVAGLFATAGEEAQQISR